jgi:uncharacterized membrane protein (UPF0136 family)
MPWTIALSFAYGILTIALGVVAFVHAGSKMSLIFGGLSGLLVLVGAVLARQHPRVGFGIVLFVAVATLGRFGMNFASKKDLYPDGVIVALSLMGLAAAIGGFMGSGK